MSIYGIRVHAQVQTINGKKVEFQPEHLMCDKCWSMVDFAYQNASIFGHGSAGKDLDENFKPTHRISCEVK